MCLVIALFLCRKSLPLSVVSGSIQVDVVRVLRLVVFFFCLFFLNASRESVRREANLGPLRHCVSATVSHVSPPKNTVQHHH